MTLPDTPEIERKVAAQLGQRLLRILTPLRVRSLSLHDVAGDPLWVDQAEQPPELQRLLLEVQPGFELDRQLDFLEREVSNGRALFFCTRMPNGDRAGTALAVVSARRRPHINQAALTERVFATLRRFSAGEVLSGASMVVRPEEPDASRARATALEKSRRLLDQDEAVRGSLRLRPYVPLRPSSGPMRRYEIAESSVSFLEHDISRVARLLRMLQRRGNRTTPVPASFSLPLCAGSVLSSDFMSAVTPALVEAGHGPETIGFTIPASAWEVNRAATVRFLERCVEVRAFACLDEFNLVRGGFDLLRAPALRCVRLDGALTVEASGDRFVRANVAAISKAARVLGLYSIATAVKSRSAARWLATAGIDYVDRSSRAGKADATTRAVRVLKVAEAG